MAKRKLKKKTAPKKPSAPAPPPEQNLMAQVGVMRLTAALLQLGGQAFADAGGDKVLDLRQFLPRVEDRREVMASVFASEGLFSEYNPADEYNLVNDAQMMFWLSDQIEERVESLLGKQAA